METGTYISWCHECDFETWQIGGTMSEENLRATIMQKICNDKYFQSSPIFSQWPVAAADWILFFGDVIFVRGSQEYKYETMF